jgi:Gluconate 2-dehydrogenase subunit 3
VIERRTTLKWILAATTAMPLLNRRSEGEFAPKPLSIVPGAYGDDPELTKIHHPGDLWPLTFTSAQRRTVTTLCDIVIPADSVSPSASSVGVVEFLDEWVSAPYPSQRIDRTIVLDGLRWMNEQASRRFNVEFADLNALRQCQICNDVCYIPNAAPEFQPAAEFFTRFRDLTAGGFYTTPQGMKDLKYLGNVPMPRFDGPPPEVLRRIGLTAKLT